MDRAKKSRAVYIVVSALLIAAAAGCGGGRAALREENILGARASGFLANGDIPRAIEVYKSGFAAARRADNTHGAAQALSNIGRAYYELGQLDSAVLYFVKAHEDFTAIGNAAEASRAAAWASLAFAASGDAAQSARWHNTATSLVNTNRPRSNRHFYALMKALADFNISPAGVDETALDAAYRFYRREKNHAALATVYMLKADIELLRGNCAAATVHLENALSSMERAERRTRRSRALMRLAEINFCTGDAAMGRHFYGRAHDTAPRGTEVVSMEEAASCKIRCR